MSGNPVFLRGTSQASIETGLGARRLGGTNFASANIDLRTVNAAPFSNAWGAKLTFLDGVGPRAFIIDSIGSGSTLVVELVDGTTVALVVSNLLGFEFRLAINRTIAAGSDLVGGVTFIW